MSSATQRRAVRATIQGPNILLPGTILWADDATPEERRRVLEYIYRNPYWERNSTMAGKSDTCVASESAGRKSLDDGRRRT
jgi:hypothetical protein